MPAKVAAIEYDPNRSARIALLHYADGEKAYILAPNGLNVGDQVISAKSADIQPGNSIPLRFIPLGTSIHNVELKVGAGGQLGRSAGTSVTLMAKEGKWATLRLPSGEMRKVHIDCRATIGGRWQRRPFQYRLGKSGSYAMAWQASTQPRRFYEPSRPSHGWWRGALRWWSSPVYSLGQAD